MKEGLSEGQVQLEEDLNATADQDVGTAVAVCDGEGRYDDGSLLEVCELHYDVDSDTWTPQQVAASLLVDPLLLNAVTDPATETLHTTLQRLHPDISIRVRVQPKRVPPGWRQGRIEARLSDVGPNNQATYQTLPEDHPRKDGLRFHNASELRMYEALVRAQQRRPQEATIGILPGAGFRASQRTFWPDFVITHRGRVGVIEVDGPATAAAPPPTSPGTGNFKTPASPSSNGSWSKTWTNQRSLMASSNASSLGSSRDSPTHAHALSHLVIRSDPQEQSWDQSGDNRPLSRYQSSLSHGASTRPPSTTNDWHSQ